MRKILIVANVAKEHINKFHIPTIQQLKSEGWEVDVACAGEETVPGCDHQFHMKWKRNPFSIQTVRGIAALRKIIKEGNYDLIYCHTPVGGLTARLAARPFRKSGLKVVYFAHGLHFYQGAPLLNWLVYYPVEKFLAHFTDAIVTVNQEDYRNAQKMLKYKRICLLDGMGINLSQFRNVDRPEIRFKYRREWEIPQDAWVLVYLAELIPNKNQAMLIKTLQTLMQTNSETYLVLAGVDHNEGRDLAFAKQLGIETHVLYLGWRNDKENIYAAADVCVASSIREGFGLNLVEAMASGLPIVATKNRGHSTIICDGVNGYLVDINDDKGMAEQVCRIMRENPIKEQSPRAMEKYDERIIIRKIIDFLSASLTQ